MPLSLFEVERTQGPLAILTVCTGNICRSALAEMLLRKVLHGLSATVTSAGTHALVGQTMTEQNQVIAQELGVTLEVSEAHIAKQLDVAHVREADLVLALTRDHRREVVELLPRASRRAFTLTEFARLAAAVDLDDLDLEIAPDSTDTDVMRAAIELVAQVRGTLPPLDDPSLDDVVDPYRQSDEVYAQSAQQIVPAINDIAAFFRSATARYA